MDGLRHRHRAKAAGKQRLPDPTVTAPAPDPTDRLGAHRTDGVREAIEKRGAEYRFLPPYSPDLSPVENCGSKVKEAIRAEQPRTVDAVYEAMGRALASVTLRDAHGWFERVGY